MKMLLLNGHGIDMRVSSAKLHIKDGFFSTEKQPEKYVFSPKRIDIDHIVIYGNDGNISIDAIRWMIKHNVQISVLNWDGKMLTTMLPPISVQVATKFKQYEAYNSNELRIKIGKQFIEAKVKKTETVLSWLQERYPTIEFDFSKEISLFKKANTITDIMMTEGRIACIYWREFNKIIPEKYEFESRQYNKRPWGAGDKVNCMLNYGYALLEAECMRAINSAGLDVHVGFLHEKRIGKNSLAYDFQEPYRFLVDMAIIEIIENKIMKNKDFIRTENYNLRLRPSGTQKITVGINNWINKKVDYKGQNRTWSFIILDKARELSHYLTGKKKKFDVVKPDFVIERQDADDIRKKILSIEYKDWQKLGFSKGSLWYMKKNAKGDKPFTLNKQVRERLRKWDELMAGIKN